MGSSGCGLSDVAQLVSHDAQVATQRAALITLALALFLQFPQVQFHVPYLLRQLIKHHTAIALGVCSGLCHPAACLLLGRLTPPRADLLDDHGLLLSHSSLQALSAQLYLGVAKLLLCRLRRLAQLLRLDAVGVVNFLQLTPRLFGFCLQVA